MAINTGYLTASSSPASDECLTPRYGVLPIVKYLAVSGYRNIHCPFDLPSSQYVRVLVAHGFNVTYGHLETGQDFFTAAIPEGTDCIVSNPPFSCKDRVLERLYMTGLPFAVLLPQNSLQSIERVSMYMRHGLEYLGFDRRVNFYTRGDLSAWKGANHFACGYFCYRVLHKPLVFERLEPIQEHYFAV